MTPDIYLVADNLDAALAAGEDLLKLTFDWDTGTATDGKEIAKQREAQRACLDKVRILEHIIMARVLKTHDRAQNIAKQDQRFGSAVRLFNSSTLQLTDAVSEFGDTQSSDFDNGGSIISYLRSRGLLAKDQPGPGLGQKFKITEDFLIAGRARLGTLLDLIAMFLDTLEVHYELFTDVIDVETSDYSYRASSDNSERTNFPSENDVNS
ncbi:MAG: hypothetical protein ACKOW3_09765 [Hyphomicrobium sp.]